MKIYNIYRIISRPSNKIYIGSTSQNIYYRFKEHLHLFFEKSIYCSSFEVLQYEDATIELLFQIIGNRTDARIEEQRMINKFKLDRDNFINPDDEEEEDNRYPEVINSNRAYISPEEMIIYNRNLSKQTYLYNKNFVTRPVLCSCNKTYQRHNKTNHDKTQHHIKYSNEFINIYSNN